MSKPIPSQDISVILHSSEFRGDHTAEITGAHRLRARETVTELAARLLADGHPSDYIVIRVARFPDSEAPS